MEQWFSIYTPNVFECLCATFDSIMHLLYSRGVMGLTIPLVSAPLWQGARRFMKHVSEQEEFEHVHPFIITSCIGFSAIRQAKVHAKMSIRHSLRGEERWDGETVWVRERLGTRELVWDSRGL